MVIDAAFKREAERWAGNLQSGVGLEGVRLLGGGGAAVFRVPSAVGDIVLYRPRVPLAAEAAALFPETYYIIQMGVQPFLAREYYDGPTLAECMTQLEQREDVANAAKLLAAAWRPLERFHRQARHRGTRELCHGDTAFDGAVVSGESVRWCSLDGVREAPPLEDAATFITHLMIEPPIASASKAACCRETLEYLAGHGFAKKTLWGLAMVGMREALAGAEERGEIREADIHIALNRLRTFDIDAK